MNIDAVGVGVWVPSLFHSRKVYVGRRTTLSRNGWKDNRETGEESIDLFYLTKRETQFHTHVYTRILWLTNLPLQEF